MTFLSKLYAAPDPAAAPVRDPLPGDTVGQILYDKSAPVVDPSVLHPIATALRPTFANRADDHRVVLGRTEAERVVHDEAFTRDIIRGPNLDPYGIGKLLYDHQVDGQVAAARHGEDPELAAKIVAWGEDTRQRLDATYGRGDTDALLARAKKFVAAHPQLSALLGTRGIGSRPEVVTAIVEHVRRVNFR